MNPYAAVLVAFACQDAYEFAVGKHNKDGPFHLAWAALWLVGLPIAALLEIARIGP